MAEALAEPDTLVFFMASRKTLTVLKGKEEVNIVCFSSFGE